MAMTATAASTWESIPHAPLSEAAAEAWLSRTCFAHGPPGRLGLEVELLPVPVRQAQAGPGRTRRPVPLADLHNGVAGLPLRSVLTVEPGGQIELSGAPAADLPTAIGHLAADLRVLHRDVARRGWRLAGIGLDPGPTPPRILRDPRYAAMEAYYDRWGTAHGCGPAGRAMMRATASVQVNVEAVTPAGDAAARWDLLHAIGPTLVAAFANSPLQDGRVTGWKSTREAIWLALDPARCQAPRTGSGGSPEQAWARWCLDAPVMLVRRAHGPWTAPRGLTFRQWIRAGRRAVPDRPPPDVEDLVYHLTTVFPPVRARGHLEVRYLDAQPGPWWVVPPAVLAALLEDARALDRARDVCSGVQDRWCDAARIGLDDPELARAARRLLQLAADTLLSRPATAAAGRAVAAFCERWTARRRCPADDLLTAHSPRQREELS